MRLTLYERVSIYICTRGQQIASRLIRNKMFFGLNAERVCVRMVND